MLHQPTPRGAVSAASTTNPTSRAERDADETLERLLRVREDADTPDDAVAEQAWRQVSRLASRLSAQGRGIAIALEGRGSDQRDLVAASLLQHPDAPTGKWAR